MALSPRDLYAGEREKQISEIKEKDPSLYRISQTLTRDESTNDYGITSMYNDALAYNYWSISGYTSSPDGRQLALLQNFGYPVWGDCLNSTNTSILPADSLLGVKLRTLQLSSTKSSIWIIKP